MQQFKRANRWIMAFSLTEVMAVSAIISALPASQYVRAKQLTVQTECVSNLQQVGQIILMYHMSEGKYPKAAFFPKNAKEAPDSIINVLAEAGQKVPDKMWICPAAPEEMQKLGLTFVYNDTIGGRSTLKSPDKAWLLIEMNCVSKSTPAPHPRGYNILFADGHVITSEELPPSITAKQQSQLRELELRLAMGPTAACQGAH